MDHLFRNSAFGGFNRQDVLTYLENSAKEAAQQKEALQQELEKAGEAAAKLESELAELRGQLSRLEREHAEQQAKLEQSEAALTAANARCGDKSSELERARAELKQLRGQLEEMAPDAQAYREIKERTAGIELEAHRRAQAIEEKAQADAAQLRRRMEQWMQRVSREYDGLRSEVEATVAHAADQLAKAGRTLEQVNTVMGEQDMALESLEQAYANADPEKVAAPMPIPEE